MTEERRDRAFVTEDEVDKLGEITDTEIYQGELEARAGDDQPDEPDANNLEALTALELRAGETADPNVAAEEGLAWVSLIAPTSPPERVEAAAAVTTGFVYAVSTLGVTGAREQLAGSAARVVESCRAATGLPVLVGIGVSTPEQAKIAAGVADGVVIGSAVVRLLGEKGARSAAAFLAEVRAALDPD